MNFHDADGGLEEVPTQEAKHEIDSAAAVPGDEALDGGMQADKDENSAETHAAEQLSLERLSVGTSGVEIPSEHGDVGHGIANNGPTEIGPNLGEFRH